MFDLSGKSALVTGASGAIGGAIARALHQRGAAVGLSGTRVEALQALAAALGEPAHVLAADLDDPASLDGLFGRAEAAMGQVDILVNNAGVTRDGLAVRMRDEDWRTVLDINLTAAFRLARASLRGMMKRRWGRIVGITSVVGVTGNPGQANYAAAKAGLVGFTKSLAQENAIKGITVNAIAPGYIATEMVRAVPEEVMNAKILPYIPVGRLGEPEEVARCVVFLAADEAGFITGSTLTVNGGQYMT